LQTIFLFVERRGDVSSARSSRQSPRHISMIFKPTETVRLWDTWLYFHEGKHYLFYLSKTQLQEDWTTWDSISLALSDDGVHFEDYGPILHKADDANWLGTGMVWQVDSKFMLNFSEERKGQQQIFFAESSDLLDWRRLPANEYRSELDPTWYATAPAFSSQRWDCIWVIKRQDVHGYIGFLTTVAKNGPTGLCGTAGCVLSDDGRHFRAAPPVIQPGKWGDQVEVGAVEQIGDKYYMLLGVASSPLGARRATSVGQETIGLYVLTAEHPLGPYEWNVEQPVLLAAASQLYVYFARFYRVAEQLLLNHHTIPRDAADHSYFSPLKSVQLDVNGVLSLAWWAGNEALKGNPVNLSLDKCSYYGLPASQTDSDLTLQSESLQIAANAGSLVILPIKNNFEQGIVLEAVINFTQSYDATKMSGVGIFIETHPNMGTLLLAQMNGQLTTGWYSGYGYKLENSTKLHSSLTQKQHWRLLVRGLNVELYMDNVLVQCYSLVNQLTGRLGFVVENGAATIRDLHMWEMSFRASAHAGN
jgi:hypothetical protein